MLMNMLVCGGWTGVKIDPNESEEGRTPLQDETNDTHFTLVEKLATCYNVLYAHGRFDTWNPKDWPGPTLDN